MGHSVHLIIGKGAAIAAFLQQWPSARAVDMRAGWQAIPVDEALYDAIEARHSGANRPSGLDVSPLGLSEALAEATAKGGGLAYVETEYFGGTGTQASTAFIDGREVVAPQSARAAGPINQALRRIGVTRTDADDEFDTIGLGERRSMMDYEPEGPVRLRGALPSALPSAPPQQAAQNFVPMWVVMLVIAAAVGVGIMASVMR
jgi:hypothetical protein